MNLQDVNIQPPYPLQNSFLQDNNHNSERELERPREENERDRAEINEGRPFKVRRMESQYHEGEIMKLPSEEVVNWIMDYSSKKEKEAKEAEANFTLNSKHPYIIFPQEMHETVFTHLEGESLVNFSRVSTRSNDIIRNKLCEMKIRLAHATEVANVIESIYINDKCLLAIVQFLISMGDLTKAKEITNQIEDEGCRAEALAVCGEFVAARETANKIDFDSPQEARTLIAIFQKQTDRESPEAVRESVNQIEDVALRAKSLGAIGDIVAARETASQIDDEDKRIVIEDVISSELLVHVKEQLKCGNKQLAREFADHINRDLEFDLELTAGYFAAAEVSPVEELAKRGYDERAIEVARKIRIQEPDSEHLLLAAIAAGQAARGDFTTAIKTIESFKTGYSEDEGLLLYARNEKLGGNFEGARVYLCQIKNQRIKDMSDEPFSEDEHKATFRNFKETLELCRSSREAGWIAIAGKAAERGDLETALLYLGNVEDEEIRNQAIVKAIRAYIKALAASGNFVAAKEEASKQSLEIYNRDKCLLDVIKVILFT